MSIPVQCPLPWLGHGDPVVIGQPAARFVRKRDPSNLDEYGVWVMAGADDRAWLCRMDKAARLNGQVEYSEANSHIVFWDIARTGIA